MREQMRRQQEEMRERMQRQQDEMQSRMRRQQEEIQERIRQDQERMRRDMERMRERPTPPVLRNQPPDLERGIPATPRFSPRRPRLGAPNLPSTGRGADGAPFGRGGVRRPSLSPEAAGRVGLVLLLAALGWLWQQASTGIGLAHIHRFGAPASVGAVLVANLAGGVAAVVGVLTLGAFVGALAAAVLGGR